MRAVLVIALLVGAAFVTSPPASACYSTPENPCPPPPNPLDPHEGCISSAELPPPADDECLP